MKAPSLIPANSPELKLTPMIDVVFLLLIFFIWTSSFEVPEFDLPSAIAEPALDQADRGQTGILDERSTEPFDELIIRLSQVDARLVIELNDQPIDDWRMLRSRLREIISLGVQPAVIIDPADEISMNVAVAGYDAARAAGADRVLFAAKSE